MERITSRRDPLCAHIRKLGESKDHRYNSGEFLCDGIKLLEEATGCGAVIKTVLTARDIVFPLPPETRVGIVHQDLLDSLSPLTNAQDVLFSCAMPKEIKSGIESGAHILLDCLQDPGNVGAIIRSSYALGADSVILTGDCADPYNPKAVRASMGAVFRQPIRRISYAELAGSRAGHLTGTKPPVEVGGGMRMIGASPRPGGKSIFEIGLIDVIIAIGSEGGGLSGDVANLCDEMLTIPINPECESLNAAAAAAIIMWEAKRQASLPNYEL